MLKFRPTKRVLMEIESNNKSWKEECAIVGVFNCEGASLRTYYSLFAMQHRGQEASGISVSNDNSISTIKGLGLVTQVFTQEKLDSLKGQSAIGHNRYATAGENSLNDAQPIFAKYSLGEIAIAHNGNIINASKIRENLTSTGSIFQTNIDTEVIAHLIAKSNKDRLTTRIMQSVEELDGSFSLVILSRQKLFALRDRFGIRPLSVGEYDNKDGTKGYIVASESVAFDIIGARYIREIEPGEMIVFEKNKDNISKLISIKIFDSNHKPCIFEYIYFARPDSVVFNRSVYSVRKSLGRQLAKEHKVKGDIVIPVPDSGLAAALGYAEESKIPFELGLVRNHYVGRTFIGPNQEVREMKVRLKLNPIREVIKGKKVIVIDDSLVRGTTSKAIIHLLKEAGAKEVHLLISAPPTILPCFYGVDTPTQEELISFVKSLEEVRDFIGATSLGFLSLKGLENAVDKNHYSFCQACFDGVYLHDAKDMQ